MQKSRRKKRSHPYTSLPIMSVYTINETDKTDLLLNNPISGSEGHTKNEEANIVNGNKIVINYKISTLKWTALNVSRKRVADTFSTRTS